MLHLKRHIYLNPQRYSLQNNVVKLKVEHLAVKCVGGKVESHISSYSAAKHPTLTRHDVIKHLNPVLSFKTLSRILRHFVTSERLKRL